jgi:hypothetical protein
MYLRVLDAVSGAVSSLHALAPPRAELERTSISDNDSDTLLLSVLLAIL